MSDIRFAFTTLLRTPGFTLVAVLTLGLGIGMSVACVLLIASANVTILLSVRMALGGSPGKVVALIVRQGLVPVAAGLLLGVATALILMRVLTSRLYGVAAHDPLAFSGAAFLVFGIAALATWLPARRAARVEPMTVLRSE